MNRVEPLDQSVGTNSTDLPGDTENISDHKTCDTKPSSAETVKIEDVERDADHNDLENDDIRNEETLNSSSASIDTFNDDKKPLRDKLAELDNIKPESKYIDDMNNDNEEVRSNVGNATQDLETGLVSTENYYVEI